MRLIRIQTQPNIQQTKVIIRTIYDHMWPEIFSIYGVTIHGAFQLTVCISNRETGVQKHSKQWKMVLYMSGRTW